MTLQTDHNRTITPLLLLIDGHSLAFRAYYAFATNPLHTSTGIPTSVCFGFLNSLLQVIESQKPQYIAVAFDRGEPTFRHEVYSEYKANRKETPEDFITDINNLQTLLSSLNIKIVTAAGYEADDILGTLATRGSESGYQVKIVSGDRDLFQLIDTEKNISVLYLDKNAVKRSFSQGITEFDPEAVEKKLGIKPSQVVDYKALCGDKSDNIPGVKGVGDKTAVKLLKEYGTLKTIYQNLDQIKGAVKKKLEAGKKDAEESQYLAQLLLNTPLDVDLETCKLQGFDPTIIIPWLEKLELKKFIKTINHLQQQLGGTEEILVQQSPVELDYDNSQPKQLSLFDTAEMEQNQQIIKKVLSPVPITPEIIDTTDKLNQLVNRLKNYKNPAKPVAWGTRKLHL